MKGTTPNHHTRAKAKATPSPDTRYTYLGDRFTLSSLKNAQCDPVRREDGKCICGKNATMLVVFGDGSQHVVLRRLLRINKH